MWYRIYFSFKQYNLLGRHKPTPEAKEFKTVHVMKFRLPFVSQRALISLILSHFGLIDTKFSRILDIGSFQY